MRNITNILLLLMCMVGFLPSCTEDDTVKERTYDLSFGFESLTEFANIGKQSFVAGDSVSLLAWKKNAEIVDLSGLVINNIRWGYNGGEWLPAEELNVETAEGAESIVALYPHLNGDYDLEYLKSVPLNRETDLLYARVSADNGLPTEKIRLKSVFAALAVSFDGDVAPTVGSFTLEMYDQAFLNVLTGEVRTEDVREKVTLEKSTKVKSLFAAQIVPQTLLSGTTFMVGFLPSCTEDDTVKERTYDLSFGFESLTEFANIGKQSFVAGDSVSLLAWKKNAEIVDLSGLVINNIRWGYNGGEWLPAEELNVETAEGAESIVALYPHLNGDYDLEYLKSVPLNRETDLLYARVSADNGLPTEKIRLKSVFAALAVSFDGDVAPTVGSFTLEMYDQAFLNVLTGEVRTEDVREKVTLEKSTKVKSLFAAQIVPQTLLSGTTFMVSGISYTYDGEDVAVDSGEVLLLNFKVIPGETEDKGIVTVLDKEDFDIKDFDDNGTVEGELD